MTMALARFLVILLLFSCAEAGEVGVNYGMVANNLPDPAKVSKLLKDNGITMVRIYDVNPEVLRSLAHTGIKVTVMLINDNITEAASKNASYARQWVQKNVKAFYPDTKIHGVAVGNEVFRSRPDLNLKLVPAMTNVYNALVLEGLAKDVKVSTPIAFSAVNPSFPPSAGRFKDNVADPVMKPMLQFLQRTGSDLAINIYPYLTYVSKPNQVRLEYALGNYELGVQDPETRLVYHSLLDAQLDATYYAIEKLGFSVSSGNDLESASDNVNVRAHIAETGYPSRGTPHHGNGRRLAAGDGNDAATVANARAYNNYVINRVLSGNTGTPHRPDADMDVYIFALFNENSKGGGPDDIEQNFGLFYPNMSRVYEFDFNGGGAPPAVPTPAPESWCVANATFGDERLQGALDWACGHGADCSAIQPGASCFQPDTKVAHATYAFNDYYQRKGRASGSCDMDGAASVVNQAPDICWSWCVANASVGDERLQGALDWACGHGADCSAIQPGASCFQPDTKVAHATYAFNDYYQRKGRASGSCDLSGAASVVYQPQKVRNCVLPPPNA